MISPSSRLSGFTLIELLIVMFIVSLGVSLVGGFSISSYAKFQVVSESKQLENLISSIERKAWLTEQNYKLDFARNTLKVSSSSNNNSTHIFDHISFPSQSLEVSRLGVLDKTHVTYLVDNRSKRLTL